MIISQEKIEELKNLGSQKVELKITGINGLGFEFETAGRITTDDNMQLGVYDECVYFEFGNNQAYYAPQRTDIIAPFVTNYDKKIMGNEVLIIDKITLPTGEVVFENEDFAKYVEIANENAEEYAKTVKKEGRELVEADPVTAKLPSMIGKPLIVGNVRRGVLVNFMRVANNGSVIIEFLDGPGRCNDFVRQDTRIFTTDLQGNNYLVEVNGKTQEECEKINEIFETRKQNIIEAEKARKAEKANASEPAGPQ